ncbi:MAG: D-aminoacylase [Betaproteobacteria bacterium]|nr:D-aminoacylase [Betaproteobacteria bacterium]
MTSSFDLVIRGGEVADGLGGALRSADVAVRDGLIVEVGKLTGSGKQEIDARGLLVTPGFVDIHTHYDGQVMWDSQLAPSSWHGVTTAVMGNCGVGFAPVRTRDHERLIELMEGVEDIPGAALHEGLGWGWESFADYLDAVERRPHDIDVCAQLPHGALRVYVMGERAARLEAATPDDIAQMRSLAAEAMRAGALGFSTSRSMNHRSIKGDPIPSLRATRDELMGIALGLRDAGRGVLQFISDFNAPSLEVEFAMLRELVEVSGRPMSISLAQRHSSSRGWRKLLDLVGDAVGAGLTMRAQVAPRPIGVLFGLQGSRNPFSACPSFKAEVAALPLAGKVERLRDPLLRARLLVEIEALQGDSMGLRLTAFDRIFPFGDPPEYEPAASSSLAAQAVSRGVSAAELAYDLLLEDEGRAFLFAPFANYADYNLDACREMLDDPNTVVGLGDGGAHVSIISDGSFPTYLLTHWGRDRPQGRFDLAWLVKRQTSDTARAVGLLDRGVIAPGMKADLNVIDMAKLGLSAPVMSADLPAGGKRLLQRASGYVATIVSGVAVYRDGQATGALPGRLVRGPQHG